jgi:hypothetical protein
MWASIALTVTRMPYPPPEKASSDDIIEILSKLQVLLRDLPAQLPLADGFGSE